METAACRERNMRIFLSGMRGNFRVRRDSGDFRRTTGHAEVCISGKKLTFAENMDGMSGFSETLLSWYREHGRDLPWRDTDDPYRIWVSEVILQQTRVAQGYDYYRRFVARFPDVESLAGAGEDEVMKCWQGLGYYSRARNLHAAARQIVERGAFPTELEGVKALKGVGDYTAAAICSFAYGQPCAVVDGNVYRVLSRYLGVDEAVDTGAGKKVFAALADEMLDRERPAEYNQAIMDFGALQCVPSSPDCSVCPLSDSCAAFRKGMVEALPRKARKTKVTERHFHYMYVCAGAYTFIRRRGPGDIWQNLYEFPLIETSGEVEEEALFSLPDFRSLFGSQRISSVRLIERGVKHVLSHRVIYASCHEIKLSDEEAQMPDFRKIPVEAFDKFPVSRLISRFFSIVLKPEI